MSLSNAEKKRVAAAKRRGQSTYQADNGQMIYLSTLTSSQIQDCTSYDSGSSSSYSDSGSSYSDSGSSYSDSGSSGGDCGSF